jgi:hypothetical protein
MLPFVQETQKQFVMLGLVPRIYCRPQVSMNNRQRGQILGTSPGMTAHKFALLRVDKFPSQPVDFVRK